MFFKNLLIKWKGSIEIFKNKESLKLFLLASLNTFKRSFLILIKKFWWIFIVLLYFLPIIQSNFWIWKDYFTNIRIFKITDIQPLKLFHITDFSIFNLAFIFLLFILIFFLSILAIRPSVERKDLFYFYNYKNKFFGFLVIYLFLFWIQIIPIFFLPILFFMDSKTSLKSFENSIIDGFKMGLYYFPAFFIFNLSFIIFKSLFLGLMLLINYYLNIINVGYLGCLLLSKLFYIIIYLLHIFYLCVISVYYLRVKHKDFYFFNKKN